MRRQVFEPGINVPQKDFPLFGNGTYFVPLNSTYEKHCVGGFCPKCTKLIGPVARPLSVQLVTLRKSFMNDARVGFFPAT